MSTVESTGTCPQCAYQGAITCFRTQTGEESFLCPKCGYGRSSRLATEGESGEYKKNGDQYIWENEEGPGFGAYRFNSKRRRVSFVPDRNGLTRPDSDGMMWLGGGSTFGAFNREADFAAVLADLRTDENFEPTGSYVTQASGASVTFLFGQESDLYNYEEAEENRGLDEAVPV